jgi:hypothetical protein
VKLRHLAAARSHALQLGAGTQRVGIAGGKRLIGPGGSVPAAGTRRLSSRNAAVTAWFPSANAPERGWPTCPRIVRRVSDVSSESLEDKRMARLFPPSDIQAYSQRLRNEICRLATPLQMAEVSSHLRNFAVAEVIGFIAMLDGHPRIIGQPMLEKAGAGFQQAKGTIPNPLAHAVPSNMLLNGDNLVAFYRTTEARNALQRVFGMGVMAPDDWEKQAAFHHPPRENNIVDTIAERHHYGGGLVEAFEACGEAAVTKSIWDGSGKRQHDLGSLAKFVGAIYESTWVPRARAAYVSARLHLANQINKVRSSRGRLNVLEQRRDILEAQILILERETTISPEAARNVWKFAAAETWS